MPLRHDDQQMPSVAEQSETPEVNRHCHGQLPQAGIAKDMTDILQDALKPEDRDRKNNGANKDDGSGNSQERSQGSTPSRSVHLRRG